MMVARLGSASAAASELGLHRATVTRHIEVVEASLGAKLFLRHARGLDMTDAGKKVLEVSSRVEDMFIDLQGRTRKETGQLSGELVVASLKGVTPLIMPAIRTYNAAYPAISVSLVSGNELAQLEYGEAHIAVRAGQKPAISDYVVRPFRSVRFGLYAHRDYVKEVRKGKKKKVDLADYKYIGPTGDVDRSRSPYARWLETSVPNYETALQVNDFETNLPAILARVGVGVLADHVGEAFSELVTVVPPSKDKTVSLWILTHKDLKNVAKVDEFVRMLTETAVK